MSATSGTGAWVRFFPAEWLGGTVGMPAEEIGVYITLVAMMYERGDHVPEDHTRLSRLCGLTPRRFGHALQKLIDAGKIERAERGLWNRKVALEHSRREAKLLSARDSAKARWGQDGGGEFPKNPKKVASADHQAENENSQEGESAAGEPAQKNKEIQGEAPCDRICESDATAMPPQSDGMPFAYANKSREEKSREEAAAAKNESVTHGREAVVVATAQAAKPHRTSADIDAIVAQLRKAAKVENDPSPGFFSAAPILRLIDRGLSLTEDILPVIRARVARGNARPRSWDYFVPAIEETYERYASVGKNLPVKKPEDWAGRMREWRNHRTWIPAWGPEPGQWDCRVPAEFLQAPAEVAAEEVGGE